MLYHLLVKPGSAKDEIIPTDNISASPACERANVASATHACENVLTVRTRKKAHDGEANTAVIELLSDYFNVPKTRIKILKGATSKHKTIEIV